ERLKGSGYSKNDGSPACGLGQVSSLQSVTKFSQKWFARILLGLAVALMGWHAFVARGQTPIGQPSEQGPRKRGAPVVDGLNVRRVDLYGDPLPTGALARMGTLRFRGIRDIYGLTFSPDNKTLAGAGWGNVICLWDIVTGKEIQRFTGHQGWIWSIAFSPDGKNLASGSADQTIRLWEAATGKQLRQFGAPGPPQVIIAPQQGGQQPNHVYCVAFSPDGKTLASAAHDKSIKLWSVADGKEVRRFDGHLEKVAGVAFSPNGRHLASASGDKTVRLWDVNTGNEIRKLEGHEASVDSVAFSPDSKQLVSGSDDKTARIWETATGKELKQLKGHTDKVRFVCFSPDASMVASGSHDATVRLWDPAT